MPPAAVEMVAVNVALLLPPATVARVDAFNASLVADRPDGFRFDATHLPHLTLAQLFTRRSNLDRLAERVRLTLKGRPPLPLRTGRLACGRTTAVIEIANTAALQRLHERLMATVSAFEERSGTAEAFFSNAEPARPADVEWVTRFRTAASFERFAPHLTLGVGELTSFEALSFVAHRVALCHLGRFCTCRVIFRTWSLTATS